MPLTATKFPDGKMYLQEENPYPETTDVLGAEVPNVYWKDFNRAHPPILALFKCTEGQRFEDGEVEPGYAYRDNTKDPEGEYPGYATSEDDIPSWCPYHKVYTLKSDNKVSELLGYIHNNPISIQEEQKEIDIQKIFRTSTEIINLCEASWKAACDEAKRNGVSGEDLESTYPTFATGFMQGYFESRHDIDTLKSDKGGEKNKSDMKNKGSVLLPWTEEITFMQQSVLIAAVRGPDGIRKDHPVKVLCRWLRRSILKSAMDGREPSLPYETGGGSFTGPCRTEEVLDLHHAKELYFRTVDELPHHFQLHLMHAAEILGYKHPIEWTRKWWNDFYLACVTDMHLFPETEEQMDLRLGDTVDGWRAREVVIAK